MLGAHRMETTATLATGAAMAAATLTKPEGLQTRVTNLVGTQLRMHAATIANFCSPNMPWPGEQCVSKWAGLSGVAYALPMLVSPNPHEQTMWMIAAFLSVWADYVHIHERSVFHGLDRLWASFMMLRCFALGAVHIEPLSLLPLAVVPISCFVKGRDAKELPEPSAWIFWHTCWHISGGLLVAYGTWLMHEATQSNPSMPRLDIAWMAQAIAASRYGDDVFAAGCSPMEIHM